MQKSIRVYRWEHKELGIGPLCGETNFRWKCWFREHKGPWEDDAFEAYRCSIPELPSQLFYAWSCLPLLLANMYEDAEEALEEAGFELTEWEVDEGDFVLMTDGQVAFLKHKARRIN